LLKYGFYAIMSAKHMEKPGRLGMLPGFQKAVIQFLTRTGLVVMVSISYFFIFDKLYLKKGGVHAKNLGVALLLYFYFWGGEKMLYSVPKAAKELGLDRQTVIKAIEKGQIRAVEISNRKLIPKREVERLLASDADDKV